MLDTNPCRAWAILPGVLEHAVATIAAGREYAAQHTAKEIASTSRSVSILRLFGILTHRGSKRFGGTSAIEFRQAFNAAVRSSNISSIIIEIDSPGGEIAGIDELADCIYSARGTKPILAVANSLACSAACWIGTAADKFYVTPGGSTASIGVFVIHIDESKALEKVGLKVTAIHQPQFKVEGNSWSPLGVEATREKQRRVDEHCDRFIRAVARHRSVSDSVVRRRFGQGRTLSADEAFARGLSDGRRTLTEVLATAGIGTFGRSRLQLRTNDPAILRSRLERKMYEHN